MMLTVPEKVPWSYRGRGSTGDRHGRRARDLLTCICLLLRRGSDCGDAS